MNAGKPTHEKGDEELLRLMLEAARYAGSEILSVYRTDFTVRKKPDDSPLTEADVRAERAILQTLGRLEVPVVSEEADIPPHDERRGWSNYWLVDPLDGTKEFLKRNDEFTVNIAFMSTDGPEIGVVFAPALGEWYWGGSKLGVFQSRRYPAADPLGESYRVRPQRNAGSPIRIAVSRSHRDSRTDQFIENVRRESGGATAVERGSSLKICMVAVGDADIYPRFGPTMHWDTAAAHAIARGGESDVVSAAAMSSLHYSEPDLRNPEFIARPDAFRTLLSHIDIGV